MKIREFLIAIFCAECKIRIEEGKGQVKRVNNGVIKTVQFD